MFQCDICNVFHAYDSLHSLFHSILGSDMFHVGLVSRLFVHINTGPRVNFKKKEHRIKKQFQVIPFTSKEVDIPLHVISRL